MIFVTVGTHQQPFERLLRGLAALPADELVVQYGPGRRPEGVREAVPFLSFAEMLDHFARADVVVMHAGVGSILVATNAGHTPIVVPRLKRHGEHVDDHQVHLIDELEELGKVIVVHDVADLPAAVADAPPRRAPAARRSGPLQEAVRAALYGGRPTRALAGRATVSPATRG